MKNVSYPRFVNSKGVRAVFDNNHDPCMRYSLTIPFDVKKTRTLAVILKNPSKANCEMADSTVSKVCRAALENGFSKVVIINLFPYMSTAPKGVRKFIEKENYSVYMQRNLEEIRKVLKNIDDVVVAWGSNTISNTISVNKVYDEAKNTILHEIESKTIYHVPLIGKQLKEPLHGLRWHNNSKFEEYIP